MIGRKVSGLLALLPLVFISSSVAHAYFSDNENAMDVLGQFDEVSLTDPSPIFTTSAANNAPNRLGISAPTLGIFADTTYHRLFLSDSGNNRVLVYNLDAFDGLLDRIPDNVIGQANFYSNTGSNTQSTLNAPQGIAFDPDNKRLFVASTNRILAYDLRNGITDGMSAYRVLGQTAYTTATAGNTQTGLNVPQGLYYDTTSSQLYVAESTGNRVKIFSLAGRYANNANAMDLIGQYDSTSLTAPAPFYTKSTANNGPSRTGLNGPQGVAIDTLHHRLFITEFATYRVLIYNLDSSNNLIDHVPDNILGQTDFSTGFGGVTQSTFQIPRGLAYDPDDNMLFVVSSADSRVLAYSLNSITDGMNASYVLGQSTFSVNNPGTTQSTLSTSRAAAYDSAGRRLFVADSANNRVVVYDLSKGMINGMNASYVLGQSTFTTGTAATTQAGMNVPYSVAYDPSQKYLFVAQNTGNRVTVYDLSNGITNGMNASYVLGQSNFTNTSGATTQAGMNAPTGVAYDSARKYLFVSQPANANRVTVYDLSSGISNGQNAWRVLGQSTFTGQLAAATQAGMNLPQELAYDGGNNRLYVTEQTNNRITYYDLSSISDGQNAAGTLGQNDDNLSAPGSVFTKGTAHDGPNKYGLNTPSIGVAVSTTGTRRLYVSDTSNNRVLAYNLSSTGALIDRLPDAVLGQANYYSNTAAITQTGMSAPTGIAVNGTDLYVAESGNNRVLYFDLSSGISNGMNATRVLGQSTFTSSSAATTQAGMNVPQGVTLSGSTVLFVAQSTGNRVTTYNIGDGVTNGENAVNVLGQSTFTATTAATTQAGMNVPYGIAYSTIYKSLFVAQGTANRVTTYYLGDGISDGESAQYVLGQAAFTTSTAGNTQTGLSGPRGIDIGFDVTGADVLFVTQTTSNRVSVFVLNSLGTNQAADYVLGQTLFTTTTAATSQTGMSAPQGVAFDGANSKAYISQSGNHRVGVYDFSLNFSDNLAADFVLGQSGFTTLAAATTQAGMNVPFGVAYDAANHYLFVSQGTGNRVTVYDFSGGQSTGQNAWHVLGQSNFTATAAATTQGGMNAPRGILYDASSGRLYVAQTSANRVTNYYLGSGITDGQNADDVIGQSSFIVGTAAITQTGMSGPQGLAIAGGRLFVSENTANRVSLYSVPFVTGDASVDMLGQTDDTISNPGPVFTTGGANNAPNIRGLSGPQGVTMDTLNHRLFVADATNNRILVYNLNTDNTIGNRVADMVIGQPDFHTSTAATTQTGLSSPQSVDYDEKSGMLFVADASNGRVLIYSGALTTGMNAWRVIGQTVFTNGSTTISQTSVRGPQRVLYDATLKRLFVAESTNNRVSVWDLSGTITNGMSAADVLGQTDDNLSNPGPIYTKSTAGNGPNRLGLSAPTLGVYADTNNHRLFLTDSSNNRILVYNLDGSNNLIDHIPDNVLGQPNFYSNTAASSQTGFNVPHGLAYDTVNNRLFVAEGTGNRVKIFYLAGGITDGMSASYVLGQAGFTTATAANTQVGMNSPQSVVYDSNTKMLYVAQSSSNRVTVYDLSSGIGDNPSAVDLLGQYDGTSVSAPVPIYTKITAHDAPNRLGYSAPVMGIALDSATHRLFVSDTGNNRVLVYNLDSSNNLLDRVPDNLLGQANFYTVTAANTQTGLNVPNGLAFDNVHNRLFVTEGSGNRVKVFDLSAGLTDTMNATNILGQATFTTATAATSQTGMRLPQDVLYDSANQYLFVSQTTSANRVTVYDLSDGITDGENAINVLGQANFTAGTAATTQVGLNVPYGLAYDTANKYLFVANGSGNRVTVYDLSGGISDGQNAFHVLGQTTFTGTAVANTQVGMNAPRGLTYDGTNKRLFVAQTTSNRVTVYDLSGGISDGQNAFHVLGQTTYTGTSAGTTQSGLSGPQGVLYDNGNSRLYVLENGNSRMTFFDVASITDGENAVDALGQYDELLPTPGPVYTKGTANDVPNRLGMSAPQLGLTMDTTNHRLFVSDTGNNRVLVYNLDSSNILLDRIPDNVLGQANFYTNAAATTQSGLNVPQGMAYDSANNYLFVSQSTGNRVTVYNLSSGITDGQNAIKVLGQSTFTGTSAATTQAGMNVPQGIVYDSANKYLFVAQNTGNRVTVYDLSSGITDGQNAFHVLGQSTYTGTAAATTQVGMNVPYDLAYDSTNKYLFVSEGTSNRVKVYDLSSGISDGQNAFHVLGQANYTTATAATTQAGMNAPRGIAYDSARKFLFVAQTTANRVSIFNMADGITDGESATNVIGQANFTTGTLGNTQTGFNAPQGIFYDSGSKYLYVLQNTSNRLSIFDLSLAISNGQAAFHVLGQAGFTTTTAATTQAGMNVPFGMTLSGTTTLFVAQGTGNRVTTYNIGDGVTDGENAVNVLGQTTFTATAAATTQAGMNAPRGIVYNSAQKKLYVTQTTGNRVTVYNLGDGITDGENAVNVLGQTTFVAGTAAVTQGGMSAPQGVAIDSGNARLYVNQNGAHRVGIFDVASMTDGENATDQLGQYDDNLTSPGPSYINGAANNAPGVLGMSTPAGLAIDPTYHRLFVADSGYNRVLIYNLSTSGALLDRVPDAVLGQSDFHTSSVALTQTGFNSPQGMTFDARGNRLFVADSSNNRVLIYSLGNLTNGMPATSILGQASYVIATAAATQMTTRAPQSIFYGPVQKRLYVAESTNNRISIFDADIRGVTGTIYTDRGVTPIAAGKKVAVSINGAPFAATGVTLPGGQYTITGTGGGLVMTGGSIVAVYLDNNSERGVTVTTGSGTAFYGGGGSMTGVDIYQNTLIARTGSSSQVMTNAGLASGNTNGFADVGTIYTVDNGTLNVKAGKNLMVWSGSIFTPGGNVRAGSGLFIRGVMNAGSTTIALSGAFLKRTTGTFNAGTSTVVLNGTLQSLSGSTTFYNLTKTGATTDTLFFAQGTTQTITNKLSLNGVGGGLLWLRSSANSMQWKINPTGTRSVSYLNVKDSNNINATAIDCLAGCVDSLNNINWNFAGGGSSSAKSNLFYFFGF